MLRTTPPGEDDVRSGANGPEGDRVSGIGSFRAPRDKVLAPEYDEIENAANEDVGGDVDLDDDEDFNEKPSDAEFLQMVAEAASQGSFYSNQVNRKSWERSYLAYHQQHFNSSKYLSKDFNNRSKLFIPKTRGAIRKDMAAVAASLFGSLDAINCMAGNEGDPKQRASAAVMQELVNYRTDRSNTQASIPWWHIAMGARQTSLLTGFCVSKQSWKLELKRVGEEEYDDEDTGEKMMRDVWKPKIDRPDITLFPPECVDIDPAADWTNPAQDAAYLILKYPMRIDEIRRKQRDPRMPWKDIDENILRAAGDGSKTDAAAIRRAREQGLDRYDETQTGPNFDIIWVWETYIRTAGEDWTFMSIGSQHLLTDPKPVEEVYPEQMGMRPVVFGYGAFDAFRIFPMSSAESWQELQQESNDIRNLSLDSLKQNIMPVTKVVRGRNVDLEQLKRRGQGSSIMVTNKDDVTWEKVADLSSSVTAMTQKLDLEFDDLAGQQNYGTVDSNNSLGKTLGGLKLAAGAANAVQEFDIRVWIETYVEPVLTQVIRLEQYYESDPVVLGLCGDRAQLMTKFGVDQIDDELLESNVTMRVNIGLGAGDPQQRLAKFQSAIQVALPLLQLDPDFMQGKKKINSEAVMSEVFGAAGYRDGGKRFVMDGAPPAQQGPTPLDQAQTAKLMSETEKNKALAKKALLDALAGAAKVGIDVRALALAEAQHDFDRGHKHIEQLGKAADMGFTHAEKLRAIQNVAKGLAPDGTAIDTPEEEAQVAQIKAEQGGGQPDAGAMPGAMPPPLPSPSDAIVPPADSPGAGNSGLSPEDMSTHGVPAGNAGEQRQADSAELAANMDRSAKDAPKPRKRKVTIAKRGPDGRASEFHIEE